MANKKKDPFPSFGPIRSKLAKQRDFFFRANPPPTKRVEPPFFGLGQSTSGRDMRRTCGECWLRRLGYLSLDSNERSQFQARELKSAGASELRLGRRSLGKEGINPLAWWLLGNIVYIFAYCGLVGNPPLSCYLLKNRLLSFQRQPSWLLLWALALVALVEGNSPAPLWMDKIHFAPL